MYQIKRTTTEPRTALRVIVSEPDGQDAGLSNGGTFYFEPAGKDGDTHMASEHSARVIMGDPGLAVHFACQPPVPGLKAPAPAASTQRAERRRERKAAGKPAEGAVDAPTEQPAVDLPGQDETTQ